MIVFLAIALLAATLPELKIVRAVLAADANA
jgi:hypothetical protein